MSIADNVLLENIAISNIKNQIINKLEQEGVSYYSNDDIKTLIGRLMYVGIGVFLMYSADVPNVMRAGTTITHFSIFDDDFNQMKNTTIDIFINGDRKSYITNGQGHLYVPITTEVGDTIELLVKADSTAIFYKTYEITS